MPTDPRVGAIRAPGFPCPECSTPIVVEAVTLLAAGAIQCTRCGLELTIQREASAPALDALSEYMTEFEKIQSNLPDLESSKPDTGPRRRGRAPGRKPRTRSRARSR